MTLVVLADKVTALLSIRAYVLFGNNSWLCIVMK